MKILVFGSDGFIGRNVCDELEKGSQVIRVTRSVAESDGIVKVDLMDPKTVMDAINKVRPDVIVNCAGIVDTSQDTDLNVLFTKNILEQASQVGGVKKVVICGSAGEYGRVTADGVPVNEETPLNADSGYGLSKTKEEKFALEYGKEHGLNVVVMRIFNPIGQNMAERFLLMRLIRQVKEVKAGERDAIEVARLDAKRDYVAVQDIATAIRSVVEGNPKEHIYNVGTGKSTTNGELLEAILHRCGLKNRPKIIETSTEPEPLVAIQADTSRLSNEFGWRAVHTVDDIVSGVVDHEC